MAVSREKWTKAQYNKAIDAFIVEENKRIGETESVGIFPARPSQYPLRHSSISASDLRVYANSIGDTNPLWRDPTYGINSRYGSIIAPPMAECIITGEAGWPPWPKVPGWQQHPYGSDREYFKVIYPGDEFKAFDKWLGIKEIEPPRGWPHRVFVRNDSRTYINQKDEPVCTGTNHLRCVARFPGEEEPVPVKKIHRCTKAELDMVHRAYDEELEGKWRRGNKIRYWEDTKVGEKLPEMVLGPYDLADANSWVATMGNAHAYAIKWARMKAYIATSSVDFCLDPDTGEYMFSGLRHHVDSAAQIMDRVPLWFNYDSQMEANLAHYTTNWMGDDAFCKKLAITWLGRKYVGDLAFINGKVVKKYVLNDEHLVDIAITDDDQDGVRCRACKATVRLLSRSTLTDNDKLVIARDDYALPPDNRTW